MKFWSGGYRKINHIFQFPSISNPFPEEKISKYLKNYNLPEPIAPRTKLSGPLLIRIKKSILRTGAMEIFEHQAGPAASKIGKFWASRTKGSAMKYRTPITFQGKDTI